MNKLILIASAIVIITSIFWGIQSCESNDTDSVASVVKSDEFINFSMSTNTLFEKFLEYTNSLTDEEFDNLMCHINDEEYFSDLINKAGFENDIKAVKKNHVRLLNNKEYMDLKIDEQIDLFKHDSEEKLKIFSPTKAGTTTADECMQRKLNDYAWAQTTANLTVIGCTCMAEIVVAACLCYATAMANYANDIRLADRAYEDCIQGIKP